MGDSVSPGADRQGRVAPLAERLAPWADRVALAVVALLCIAAPALIGGVPLFFTVLLVACAGLALGVLCLGTPRVTPAPWLALALLVTGLVALAQLVPWPGSWVDLVSPRAAAIWRAASPLRKTFPLSLDPPATAYALAQAVAYLALLLTAERLGQDRRLSRVLLFSVAAAGLCQVAVAGWALFFGDPATILGVYPLPSFWRAPLGTFVNHNHGASLLVLTFAVTAGLALAPSAPARRLVLAALALVQLFTLLSTHCRGAIFAAGLAGALLLGLGLSRRLPRGLAAGLSVAVSLLGAGLLFLFSPGLRQRLAPLFDGTILSYQKVRVWRDTLGVARDFLATGAGRGAFGAVFPPYRTGDEYVVVSYPSSLPLLHLSELGLLFTALVWGLLVLALRQLWRRRHRLEPAEIGAAAGVAGVLLHNLVEFSLELPGVAVPCLIALGVVQGRAHRSRRAQRGGRGPLLAALCLVPLALLLAIPARSRQAVWQHEEARRAYAAHHLTEAATLLQRARAQHPADFTLAQLDAVVAAGRHDDTVLPRLNHLLALHPADAQAHRLAAWVLARGGRRQQAVLELRLAAERGLEATEASLDEALSFVGPGALPDTVAQHPDTLMFVARYLAARGQIAAAALARHRAAVLDPGGVTKREAATR